MNLRNQNLKLIIVDRNIVSQKSGSYTRNVWKKGQEVIYYSKYFNSKYIQFVGYDTRDKLIWKSGEGIRITNKMRKQGIY